MDEILIKSDGLMGWCVESDNNCYIENLAYYLKRRKDFKCNVDFVDYGLSVCSAWSTQKVLRGIVDFTLKCCLDFEVEF